MGNVVITPLLLYIFLFFNIRLCCCNGNSPNNATSRCIPSERAVLLNFKHNLTYFDQDVSSSWKGEDCCKWKRVVCDHTTGHILKLNLYGDLLDMEKLESLVYLLDLKQLESLDLSFNNFNYSSIPRLMGSMKQLRYLDLSYAYLGGLILNELGNLTNLQFLYLNHNYLSGEIPASLGKLSNLNYLDLSGNNLSSIASSLRFPSNLVSLNLSSNQLSGKIPTSIGKLSKLQALDISFNLMEGTILSEPNFANLSSLTYLDMQGTMITLNLSSDWVPPFQLQYFWAANCKINGQLPPWLQTQKNLSLLWWPDANISGVMPNWFHTMQQLHDVDLSNNNLIGSPIFPINFELIDLYNNSFSGEVLSFDNKTQVYRYAYYIEFSNNFIHGPFPQGLGHLMPNLGIISLSNNQISGPIPSYLCQLTSLSNLYIDDNSLTGVIPNCWGFGQIKPNLEVITLDTNQISGPIPTSLCQLTSLKILNIQNNSLSGVIPNCWENVSSLVIVNLSYNKLKGRVPCFNNRDSYKMEGHNNDFYLHLNDNMLSGEIPSCLSNLNNLTFLDIGENQFSGKMQKWFNPERFRALKKLRLRGNKFSGTIPRQVCSLPHLQLMDLGHNHFTGSIPPCLSDLTAMTSPDTLRDYYSSDALEVIQGIERTYTSTLPFLVDIDLSCNYLVGSIPDDMAKLSGLLNLNLSYNQLSGTIPVNIGGLKSLVSLDLSNNKLRGSIPTSIGEIYGLSDLNLSYNNLSGPIPTGNQLQTLSDQASIYAGNPYLCGDSLPKKCKSNVDEQNKGKSNKGKGNNKGKLEKMGFILVVMSGFATCFWGVVGGLVVKRSWRHAVFRRVEDCYNWLYVIVIVRMAKIRRINIR